MSFGPGDGSCGIFASLPGVYTKISYFEDWIHTVEASNACHQNKRKQMDKEAVCGKGSFLYSSPKKWIIIWIIFYFVIFRL